MHTTKIVKDLMFSIFLASNYRATYISYIRTDKMMIKHERIVLLLGKLDRDAPAEILFASHTLFTQAATLLLKRTLFL